MTIHVRKLHLAIVVLAIALIAPATAWAAGVFDDVPDGRYFTEAAEWAAAEGITTGVSTNPPLFAPDDPVTRGQNVTFLKRYHDNLVVPADEALQDGIDANATAVATQTVGLFASDTDLGTKSTTSATPVDLGLEAVVTIPEGHTGVIEIGFTAESVCYGGTSSSWCKVILYSNGTAVGDADFAFDSSDNMTETSSSWESHAMTRVTDDLPAGTYTITASYAAWWHTPTFAVDDMVLTADVHLTS